MYDIICLVGGTGSGKTTLEKKLVETDLFDKIVSVVTRPMREGEVEGYDYYFISKEQYYKEELASEFIESKRHFNTCYGVRASEILKADIKPCIFVCDFIGYKEMKEKFPGRTRLIFVDANKERRITAAMERGTPKLKERIEEEDRDFPVDEVKSMADRIIYNNFTEESLQKNVDIINDMQYYNII